MPRSSQSPESAAAVASSKAGASQSELRHAALSAFVAVDPLSLKLREQVIRIASADSTILIQGESGTGKDLLASLIHYLGPHPEMPLVKIDCASLPHELLESELFGFERGAFTGASQAKRGRLELAERGTLVLDEISALTLTMQAKMLRVMEERIFDRLGGTKPVRVNARIIALTNIDLREAVERRTFREDLYYRLNVVPITALPLRERRHDIVPIAQALLAQKNKSVKLASEAARALQEYAFPGNARELRNVLERALLHSENGTITMASLPEYLANGVPPTKKMSLEELERNYIAEILDFTRGKKSKAAEILGISRKNLLEKRKKYRLD